MLIRLQNIAKLQSGLYAKPDLGANALYLQANHFNDFGQIDMFLKPQIKIGGKNEKHLLQDKDIIFVAKGSKNFGVVYNEDIGKAVASSSFIVIRIQEEFKNQVLTEYLAWFLTNTPYFNEYHQRQLGTTIPSISIKKLNEMEIELPTIAIQKRIVEISKLRKREKALKRRIDDLRDKEIKQLLLKTLNNK
jgi:restriction endonuclease S subunit